MSAVAWTNLGIIVQKEGNYADATAMQEESLALLMPLGNRLYSSYPLFELGAIARSQGDYARAEIIYQEALALRHKAGDKEGIAACLEGLAVVCADRAQGLRTATLAGAAEIVRETIGAQITRTERATYVAVIVSARTQSDEALFNAAWTAGRSMTLEEAIDFAMEMAADPTAVPPTVVAKPVSSEP